MKVWIIMDTNREVGSGCVKGVYETEEKAKMALAEYVLETETNTIHIYLFETEVE